MDKIFDKNFKDELLGALKEAGIEENKASLIISNRYADALKKTACGRLRQIAEFIEMDKYQKAADLLSFSPAGDCMGLDSYFIDFSDVCDQRDMGDIIKVLYYKVDLNKYRL